MPRERDASETSWATTSTGDNEIPAAQLIEMDWETPATINDTWGFKQDDNNWKSADDLIRKLVDICSTSPCVGFNSQSDAWRASICQPCWRQSTPYILQHGSLHRATKHDFAAELIRRPGSARSAELGNPQLDHDVAGVVPAINWTSVAIRPKASKSPPTYASSDRRSTAAALGAPRNKNTLSIQQEVLVIWMAPSLTSETRRVCGAFHMLATFWSPYAGGFAGLQPRHLHIIDARARVIHRHAIRISGRQLVAELVVVLDLQRGASWPSAPVSAFAIDQPGSARRDWRGGTGLGGGPRPDSGPLPVGAQRVRDEHAEAEPRGFETVAK